MFLSLKYVAASKRLFDNIVTTRTYEQTGDKCYLAYNSLMFIIFVNTNTPVFNAKLLNSIFVLTDGARRRIVLL